MKVAVLKGGTSMERVVSLSSAARVEDALKALGHEVVAIDAATDLIRRIKAERPAAAFIAMHGCDGENGTVQALLELLPIPYTGPGVAACMRCTDKALAKHELAAAGIATPDWTTLSDAGLRRLGAADAFEEIGSRFGFPLIVKPTTQGSSLGVNRVDGIEALASAVVAALSYGERALIESFAAGRELAISILDGQALPAVEALPKDGGSFDFEARYQLGATEYVCPATLSESAASACSSTALRAWNALGCDGFVRVDLVLTASGPEILEVNAVPGLTDTSLFPLATEAAGISFESFVERALDLALGAAGRRRAPST